MTNPTIASLDRTAARLGLAVEPLKAGSLNGRKFVAASGRLFHYSPGGKGVIRVSAFIPVDPATNDGNAWTLECSNVVSIERMERILRSAVN